MIGLGLSSVVGFLSSVYRRRVSAGDLFRLGF